MRPSILTILLPIIGFILPSAAESAAPSIRALLLVPGGAVTTIYPTTGAVRGDGVVVGARGLSQSFRAPAREFSLAMEDKKRESGFRNVGKVSLPTDGDDFIILLEPEETTLNVHLVNSRETRFRAGSVLFFNASDESVGVTLGSSKLVIKPRIAIFGKPSPADGQSYYQVTFFEANNGKAKPFTNTRWPHRDNSRCYVFLYRDQKGRFTYQAVDEGLIPVPASE